MGKVLIAVVNGKAQSGKSTFERLCMEYSINCNVEMMSSVDKIYEVYKMLGWNGIKDDQFRADMSAIKAMYIRNCNGPINDILDKAKELLETREDYTIIFYDCREQEQMDTLRYLINTSGKNIFHTRILVRNKSTEDTQHGNSSDDFITDLVKYEIVVDNDGTIEELAIKAQHIIKYLEENLRWMQR